MDLLSEQQSHLYIITLNRVEKHNAFDDAILIALHSMLDEAIADPKVRIIVLKANGRHFSAGADLAWMQRMANFSEEQNVEDAMILARLLARLYSSPKPTVVLVQGGALGGGAGLVAACDIAIAATNAYFCFSEVKLGLIPAVISPYVVEAIGARAAKWLFMSAETFVAERAQQLGLVQHCVEQHELVEFGLNYTAAMLKLAPEALPASKNLVRTVAGKAITEEIIHYTATQIAQKRVSAEAQRGLQAFLKKQTPQWGG